MPSGGEEKNQRWIPTRARRLNNIKFNLPYIFYPSFFLLLPFLRVLRASVAKSIWISACAGRTFRPWTSTIFATLHCGSYFLGLGLNCKRDFTRNVTNSNHLSNKNRAKAILIRLCLSDTRCLHTVVIRMSLVLAP